MPRTTPFIGLDFRAAKAGFFDARPVLKALDRARLKVLKESGRLVRKHAQASLRYKSPDVSAPPGRPPFVHRLGTRTRTSRSTGKTRTRRVSFLREFLFFAYDKASKSVVVGPVRLNGTASRGRAPHVLEYGGGVRVGERTIYVSRGVGRDARGRFVSQGRDAITLGGSVRVAPHPYMRPALKAERPNFPKLWRNSVR